MARWLGEGDLQGGGEAEVEEMLRSCGGEGDELEES